MSRQSITVQCGQISKCDQNKVVQLNCSLVQSKLSSCRLHTAVCGITWPHRDRHSSHQQLLTAAPHTCTAHRWRLQTYGVPVCPDGIECLCSGTLRTLLNDKLSCFLLLCLLLQHYCCWKSSELRVLTADLSKHDAGCSQYGLCHEDISSQKYLADMQHAKAPLL